MFWPFKRKKKSLLDDLPDSPEVWRAGDLAECQALGQWRSVTGEPSTGPRRGEICRVLCIDWEHGVQFLRLAGYDANSFHAFHFRKVQPRADELKRAEPEFISLLAKQPAEVA